MIASETIMACRYGFLIAFKCILGNLLNTSCNILNIQLVPLLTGQHSGLLHKPFECSYIIFYVLTCRKIEIPTIKQIHIPQPRIDGYVNTK